MQMRFLYIILGRFSLLDSKKSPGERAPHKDKSKSVNLTVSDHRIGNKNDPIGFSFLLLTL